MGIIKQNCKILRHEATIDITQPSGASFAYFTDLTENHYKAMIDISLQSQTLEPVPAQVIVTPRMGQATTIDFTDSIVIQIEDALAVSLTSTNPGLLTGVFHIIKDFCICCPNSSEVHRHEGTFSFRGSNFLFTDLTANHYKAMIVVKGNNGGSVVVTPRMGSATTIPLPPLGQMIIQVEDAEAVSISTNAVDEGTPNTVQIIKDFCMSCP